MPETKPTADNPIQVAANTFSDVLFTPEIAPEPAPVPAGAPLEDPQAGGRYLRDPITGALTVNPN
jgi:hypothetical protein